MNLLHEINIHLDELLYSNPTVTQELANVTFCFYLLPQFYPPVLTLPIPPFFPPFLPPSSLGGRFLLVSTSPSREGCLIRAPSTLPPSLPFASLLSQPVFPFCCFTPCPFATLSLHYLPSSPSSKMTFSDFTKARQFNSAQLLQSGNEKRKQKVVVS